MLINDMDNRQRFFETLKFGHPDRVPLFSEGIREKVIDQWKESGYLRGIDLDRLFVYDRREEISFDQPAAIDYCTLAQQKNGLQYLEHKLESQYEICMPRRWSKSISRWKNRKHVLMLMVHWGLFQTMGVHDWKTFNDVMYLIADKPDFVRAAMEINGRFIVNLVSRFLKEVDIDAVIFSEPIGGYHGSLVSPQTYRNLAIPGYVPILDTLKSLDVRITIWRTYADTSVLIPIVKEVGINTIWACECNPMTMDYMKIREQYSSGLALIGGIDLDLLRKEKNQIQSVLEEKLPPLLDTGGYIPLADGRVREDIPFDNYLFYRQYLEKLVIERM